MNLISRYIVREHVSPFFFSLSVIMFVFIIKFLVRYISSLFGKGLSLWVILKFIYLNLAWMMALAVPMSVLVATLMAFGRFSADNEITILKSAGINLYRIIAPVMMCAVLLTLAMVYYNDQVLPEYNHEARMLYRSITKKKPTFQLEAGIYLRQNKVNILVGEIQRPENGEPIADRNLVNAQYAPPGADRLKNITIFDFQDARAQRTIIADHGFMQFDEQSEQLVFNLFDGEIHEVNTEDYSEYRRINFGRNVVYFSAEDQVFREVTEMRRGDREKTIQMLWDTVFEYEQQLARDDSMMAAKVTRFLPAPQTLDSLLTAALDSVAAPDGALIRRAAHRISRESQDVVQSLQNGLRGQDRATRQIFKNKVEIYKKYSIPFACIVFVLIGAPLGIRARKGSLGVGVSFSLGFFLLFWACLIGGEELADKQLVSPLLAMWFPNILVGSLGLYITYRTMKETAFIQWDRLPKFLQPLFRGGDQD